MTNDQHANLAGLRRGKRDMPELGLRGCIQHGGHLVGHKVAWLGRQRSGDGNPLQFAAAHLVRPAREPAWIDAQCVQQIGRWIDNISVPLL